MKKSNKILLGIGTIWPFIYMLLFMGVMLFSFFLMPSSAPGRGGASEGGAFPFLFMLIFPLHVLTILWIWALIAFYMVNVFKNDRVDKDKKVLWAIVLFMGHMMAMPVYWYLYIWRDNGKSSSTLNEHRALNNAEGYHWAGQTTSNRREGEYVPPPQPPDWRG
jgi:hypothetical protein